MPGKVKVKIIAGRNLPVMDRSSDTTDAYVEIKLGNTTYKTDVCRKSLNPQWNSEWYRFEVDDSELQDEPLQIRLMDHDTYSANDAIGKVYMNLNPLLIPAVALPGKYGWGGETNVDQPSSSVMSGWIPVYDTMHGIRGEVNVTVKVELFSDFNKFRQSSCGVQFFCSPAIPHGYHAQVIHGFIEELVVNDDPEYQWIDKIRTPRASNEARQTLFFKLSGELQRKIGVKALDLGGNAVIGYNQCFDLEGESGIVARGIGTVVTLVKHHEMQQQLDIGIAEEKALSYLKFLAFDNGLKLDNDNIFERFTLSSPIPNTSIFVSTPDNQKEQFTRISPRRNNPVFLRQSSQPLIEYEPLPHNLKTSISSRSLSDDIREEIALRKLLRQEEMKGGSSMSLSRKIKHLKHNMMSKKMNAMKSKLSDSEIQDTLNLDTASISSKGETNSIRTSLIDLRELRKKKKQNNSSTMAELLVRSVMHVHTSLDCIVECHDSGPPHASSTSELSEQLEESSSHQSSESQNTVLEVAPGPSYINKTISEPYLLLPDNTMVSPSSNASSDSDMSSSDGSDSPSEIKDDTDKLEFDTISLIVKNVQNEEKHEHKETNQGLEFSYLDPRINNESQNVVIIPIPATALVLNSDDSNSFVFPLDNENKIEQFEHSATLSTGGLEPQKKRHLSRALSRSCTDIAVNNEVNTKIENDMNNSENYNIALPANMEKRIEKLRFSALFKSIAERPKTKLSKTFSISHENISTSNTETNETVVPPSMTIHLAEQKKKQKMSKAFSISCEEIYSPNLAELEKRIEKLRNSALFCSGNKKSETRKKGKLARTFSVSSEENIDQEKDNKGVMLPANIDTKIDTLIQSPEFSDTGKLNPRRGKMSRALSRSCADISSTNKNEINEKNKNLLAANAEKRIGMFKNSPLFKISIMTEPKAKEKNINELPRSSTDITAADKSETDEQNKNLLPTNAEKRIGMFKNSPLFKISIMADPKSKGKMTREQSRSCADIYSPDKDEINEENKNLVPANAEKRIGMFKNSPLFKISIMAEPKEKGKMTRELSRSCADISSSDKDEINEENKNLVPANVEKRIGMFKNSPLFKISIMAEPKEKGKMTRELSRSCADISSSDKDEINEENKNLVPANAEKRIGMFKNSPLFKISIMAEPKEKGKMTRELSRSCADISSSNKDEINEENKNLVPANAEKRISMFKNSPLFKISIMAELKEKGKMIRELRRSCSDISSEKNEINKENKDLLSANIEKRIDMFKNSPLFKISIITEPKKKGKLNRELSRSHTDITSTDKYDINTENNSKSNPDLSDAGLVNTAMQTMLTEKINLLTSQPVLISPRAQSDPDLGNNSLVKTAMQTILMEKIDLMTAKQAPVSKRVTEEFQKSVATSFSRSDPDLSSHIKSTVSKIHFPIKSPSFLRKSRGEHTGSLKHTTFTSDPDVRDHNSVKSLLIDKIHLLTSKSPSLSRKFNGDSHKEDIRSEPHSPEVNSNSLVNTAMQTILMEKVNILTPPIPSNGEQEFVYTKQENIPTTPEQHYDTSTWSPEQHYMFEQPDDIDDAHNSLFKSAMQTMLMDKLNIVAPSSPPVSTIEEEPNFHAPKISKHPNLAKIKTTVHHAFEKVHILSPKHTDKKCFNDDSEPSLMRTAMQTMLIDKVHIMAPDASPQETEEDEYNYDHTKQSSPKHHDHPNLDKVKSAVHTVLDKVTHSSSKSPTSPKTDKKFDFGRGHESEPSLMKTAMQTMLIDKIHIMAPDASPEPNEEEEYNYDHTKPSSPKHHDHPNLDKVTHSSPKSPTSPKTDKKFDFTKDHNSEPSLMRTAMQTMLIDKVHIMAPDASPQETEEEEYNYDHTKPSSAKHHDHPNLDKVKSVVHTVLDKVTHSSPKSPISPKTGKKFDFGKDNDSEPSLMKTAMQTMLIDKVNILAPDAPSGVVEEEFEGSKQLPIKHEVKHELLNLDKVKSTVHTVLDRVVHNLSSPTKDTKFDFGHDQVDEENQSLMKSAMQTMLLDKVNIIASGSPQISPESQEFQFDQNSRSLSHETKEAVSDYAQIENYGTSPKSATLSHPVKEQPISSDTQSSSRSDIGKKHSIFGTLKKKCKSLKSKMSFSKLIHKKDSSKDKAKDDGLIGSAMNTILLDKVYNIQGTISSSDEEILQSKSENPSSLTPTESPPKAYNKEKLDDITLSSTCTEEPNIVIRPDSGVSCNRSTAVTADDANCNTNAEHAPCLYTSDRRIVESPVPSTEKERERDRENVRESRERHGHQRTESTGGKMSQSPARLNAIPCIHRRSSDSDLSITPKGNSLTGSDRSGGTIPGYHHIRSTLLRPTVDNFDMMEYPFLTMSKYPPGFILHLGGAVSARSVKLLERITNIEEPETRDTWWSEIRMEIRTHARALNCNAVLGYTESTSICDEVCVLSASGTAAVIALYSGELSDGVSGLPNLHKPHVPNKDLMTSSLDRTDFERDKNNTKHPDSSSVNNRENNKITQVTESPEQEATIEFSGATSVQSPPTSCRICHIPYSESTMSFRINMLYCSICKLAKVPDILLTTIEMPEGLPITGRGCFLQSYVCRPKRDLKGELNAKEISESLPFLEYELHRLLVNKMKVKAMNTIFGLKVRITIGERMLIGIATGTAVFLLPLPPPPLPKLIAGNATTEDKRLAEMQKLLVDTVKKNKEIYELKDIDVVQPIKLISDTEESDEEKSNLDLSAGNKDSCVLEVDDSEDIEVINLLVEPRPPDGFHVVNTENVPGLEELEIVRNLQMFTQVWRAKIPLNQSASHFGKHFQKLLQSVYFKLRRMIPCALCDLQFRVDLPEPDEIQLTLLGMALGLGDPMKLNKFKRKNLCHLPSKELIINKKSADDELIFSLEEDHIPENSIPVISQGSLLNPQMPKHRQKSPQRLRVNTKQRHTPIKERHGVDITPLSYVPGGKIERYLGYLNFFFIRETTSIREGGGLSGFVHSFITEVLAIVRAHVTALGGNAMVAYFMTECVLYHNAHKNQGQCLINVGGDVVFVSYFTEDN